MICTGARSGQPHGRPSTLCTTPPYTVFRTLVTEVTTEHRLAMSASSGVSIVHFRGRLVRQVSCYTLLGGFRLPWPPSCCLYQPTPLNLNEPLLDALNQLSDHPHCQSCLPKLAHLARLIQPLCSTRKREPAPFSSLRIGLGC